MARFGVRVADVEDATQEALVEAWQGLSGIPMSHEKARYQMLRIAVKIAQRWRRYGARLICADEVHVPDPRDAEAWIAARMLWLEALYRLDEPTRRLLIAYMIDERTYQEIGAEMGENEDTIRKRVKVADKKLREELDKLLGDDKHRKGGSGAAMGAGLALDPFDRAVFRAILDVEEEFGLGPSPASTVRPKVPAKPWSWQYFPMGILAIALFLVPGQGFRTEALYAAKFGTVPLPTVEVRSGMQMPQQAPSDTRDPLPRKMASEPHDAVPRLSKADAARVKQLYQDGASHTQ